VRRGRMWEDSGLKSYDTIVSINSPDACCLEHEATMVAWSLAVIYITTTLPTLGADSL
jgi:hypothetical protein